MKRSERLEVGEFCPRQPYLEAQVPEDAKSVLRLTVVTVSHDQGKRSLAVIQGTQISNREGLKASATTKMPLAGHIHTRTLGLR